MEPRLPSRPVHLMLHRRPEALAPSDPVLIGDQERATVAMSPQQQSEPFAISFETATRRLAALPRMFIEPDGSFVWVSQQGEEPAWQLDGVVNDRADRVVSVEVKGDCPPPRFEQLLRVFDWPATPMVIQLVRAAVFLEVSEYFRWDGRR